MAKTNTKTPHFRHRVNEPLELHGYTYILTLSQHRIKMDKKRRRLGQWLCVSVGRVVASDTRGPWFEYSHRQKFIYIEHLFTVNCVLKRRK